MNLLQRWTNRSSDPAAPDAAARDAAARNTAAYQEGKRDARTGDKAIAHERDVASKEAYERGRRDERARQSRRRRGSPALTVLVLAVACIGAFVIYLGVHEGSFQRGGQLVDQNINNTTSTATQATRSAADRAGDALENAGHRIKQSAGSGG
ncbi:MAG TPA: hypothetical protein VGG29_14080 [Caulobacteraceae bacterium]|jgi:hypothetical protein